MYEITTYTVVAANAMEKWILSWRECTGGVLYLPQLFRTLTFSTFSAGSKGGADSPDDGSHRRSHLFEMQEKEPLKELCMEI